MNRARRSKQLSRLSSLLDLTHPNVHLFLDSLYRLYREGEGGEGDDVEEGGLGGGGGDLDQLGSMTMQKDPGLV